MPNGPYRGTDLGTTGGVPDSGSINSFIFAVFQLIWYMMMSPAVQTALRMTSAFTPAALAPLDGQGREQRRVEKRRKRNVKRLTPMDLAGQAQSSTDKFEGGPPRAVRTTSHWTSSSSSRVLQSVVALVP